MNQQQLSSFIWSVADLLRGDYKQADYGKVILPFTVLRRLDCVLEPTKEAVLAEHSAKTAQEMNPEPFLLRKAAQSFYNTSKLDMRTLMGDQDNIDQNLSAYIREFSPDVRDIFERFEFATQIDRLAKAGLLYQVTEKFARIDLHPSKVDNHQMGLVFEELIRKFAELSNETAGEHFTPREVIRLMVNLLFVEDDDILSKPGVVRTIYDPAAGTGGMLSVAGEYLVEHNEKASLVMYGQELNPESYAICKADMLIKGQNVSNIIRDNTLSNDGHPHENHRHFHVCLGAFQPQAGASQGQGSAHRRVELLAQDAQESRLEAQGDERRRHRHRHQTVWRLSHGPACDRAGHQWQGSGAAGCAGGRAATARARRWQRQACTAVADLLERRVRLSHYHRRAPFT
ncbi:class I SAM-dependent DNA methyltransferase [Mesorhizobium sp.]|uniref:type I restriction-modification system subunit M n=1 Tax=Mesorhizobium sp. TaxID=1871066 RepID=UPI00257FCD3B|nr:class I SAM-dependent DNA methyltransferase [Mesorhizobium sp.]